MEPEFDPKYFDEDSQDIIKKLLKKDARQRLGARGAWEITFRPYFADIDFDNLNGIKPPFKPPNDLNMASQSEIGNFVDDKAMLKVNLNSDDLKQYEGWHYVSKRAFQEEIVEYLQHEEEYGPVYPVGAGQTACCTIS
jgi:serine/threonine protein kinase